MPPRPLLNRPQRTLNEIGNDQECIGVTGQAKAEKELEKELQPRMEQGKVVGLNEVELAYLTESNVLETAEADALEAVPKGNSELMAQITREGESERELGIRSGTIAAMAKYKGKESTKVSQAQKCDSAIDDFVEKKGEKFDLDRRLIGVRYDQDPALWNDSMALAGSLGSLTHDIDELKKLGECSA